MAKLTKEGLKTLCATYVDATKQLATYTASVNDITKMLDKISKTVTLVGDERPDYLPMLDGEMIPYGDAIEEYFMDFVAPIDHDDTGAGTLAPHDPTFEDCTYTYSLEPKDIVITERYYKYNTALTDASASASLIADLYMKFSDSADMFKLAIKKQLLGNVIKKATESSNATALVSTLAIPTDTATGEAFIKAVKNCVTDAKFANTNSIKGILNKGTNPSNLTLFIKKGILSSLSVDTYSGAFNKEDLNTGVGRIVEVEDFGNDATGAWALLADTRGIKLHTNWDITLTQLNAQGAFVNNWRHLKPTTFISMATYVHVFKTGA